MKFSLKFHFKMIQNAVLTTSALHDETSQQNLHFQINSKFEYAMQSHF